MKILMSLLTAADDDAVAARMHDSKRLAAARPLSRGGEKNVDSFWLWYCTT